MPPKRKKVDVLATTGEAVTLGSSPCSAILPVGFVDQLSSYCELRLLLLYVSMKSDAFRATKFPVNRLCRTFSTFIRKIFLSRSTYSHQCEIGPHNPRVTVHHKFFSAEPRLSHQSANFCSKYFLLVVSLERSNFSHSSAGWDWWTAHFAVAVFGEV
jgi:hypothetical protein